MSERLFPSLTDADVRAALARLLPGSPLTALCTELVGAAQHGLAAPPMEGAVADEVASVLSAAAGRALAVPELSRLLEVSAALASPIELRVERVLAQLRGLEGEAVREKALRALSAQVRPEPLRLASAMELGAQLEEQRRYGEAADAMLPLVASPAAPPELLEATARCLEASERYEELISVVERQLAREGRTSQMALLHTRLGNLYEAVRADEQRAMLHYARAVELSPQFEPPLQALTSLAERRREWTVLARLLGTRLSVEPRPREREMLLLRLAKLTEQELGDAAAARRLLERAVHEHPQGASARIALLEMLLGAGDLEHAERVATPPDDAQPSREELERLCLLRSSLAHVRGRAHEAQRYLLLALSVTSAPGPLLVELVLLVRTTRTTVPLPDVIQRLRQDPRQPVGVRALATAAEALFNLHSGDPESAEELLRSALLAQPDAVACADALADVLVLRRRFEEAASVLKAAAEASGRQGEPLRRRAAALSEPFTLPAALPPNPAPAALPELEAWVRDRPLDPERLFALRQALRTKGLEARAHWAERVHALATKGVDALAFAHPGLLREPAAAPSQIERALGFAREAIGSLSAERERRLLQSARAFRLRPKVARALSAALGEAPPPLYASEKVGPLPVVLDDSGAVIVSRALLERRLPPSALVFSVLRAVALRRRGVAFVTQLEPYAVDLLCEALHARGALSAAPDDEELTPPGRLLQEALGLDLSGAKDVLRKASAPAEPERKHPAALLSRMHEEVIHSVLRATGDLGGALCALSLDAPPMRAFRASGRAWLRAMERLADGRAAAVYVLSEEYALRRSAG